MNNNTALFRRYLMALSALLTVQYLLGMYVNLYVQFPQGAADAAAWEFAWAQPMLAAHILNAFLLYIVSIVLLVKAVRSAKPLVGPAIGGLVSITGAAVSGAIFVATQNDALSYAMAVFFIAAFAAYGRAFSALQRI